MWGKETKYNVRRVDDGWKNRKATAMWLRSKAAVVLSAAKSQGSLRLECCYKIHSRAKPHDWTESASQEQVFATSDKKNAGAQDPEKPAPQTLCEPAQSKATSTYHKSMLTREFTGKMPRPKIGTPALRKLAQSNGHRHLTKSNLCENV